MYKNASKEMVLCPYNRAHVVSKLRIQKHMIKCQKNYPHVKLATCFYNYSHKLQPEDMLKHYEICSHKTRVEGARYYEPQSYNPTDLPAKSDAKKHGEFLSFCPTKSDSSKTDSKYDTDITSFNSKNYASSNMDQSFSKGDFPFKDDGDDYDDDEPLPLPKTVSKAFTCIKQQQEKSSTSSICKTYKRKGFGRATNILAFSPTRQPRAIDHLLPDVSDMENACGNKNKSFQIFSHTNTNCSMSTVSSMFDDSTTLKSQSIIFDDDYEDDNNDFALKNFDKYVKI